MNAAVLAISIAVVVIAVIAVLAFTLTKLFQRTKKGFAFVKTGFGGEKVIMDGGAVILPILHEIVWICMKTRKIIVGRQGSSALITKDKFRVDVEAEFYLRVKQDKEAVSLATQSLGEGAMEDSILKQLMEGKFIDALRAVAANMEMNQLHEQRADFVQQVQENVQEELGKNGLELESVSLVSLDQTSIEHLDANNAFDAEGMTKLTEIIEDRKKIRNDIERKNQIQIEQKDLETEKLSLAIKQEEELARAEQEKTVKVAQAEREREAREAEITAARKVQEANIEKEKAVKEADIAREKAVESAEIEKAKTIEIASQQKNVEVFQKSQEESEAEALANDKKALAVQAEEKIRTAKETEIANRAKSVAIIKAQEEAEEKATAIKVAAEADKEAAANKAEAIKVAAKAESEAIKLKADADKEAGLAEAAAVEALNAAQNTISPEIVRMNITLETIKNAGPILEAMMKPVEKIDGIKMVNIGGLQGMTQGGGSNGAPAAGGSGNAINDLFSGLMNYKATMPFISDILGEAGLDASDPTALVNSLAKIEKSPETPEDPKVEASLDDVMMTEEDRKLSDLDA